jgi:hypothetical protein
MEGLDRVFDCNEPALKRLGEESVAGRIFFPLRSKDLKSK